MVVVVVVTVLLHPFNDLFSTTTWVSRTRKVNLLDFTGARDDRVAVASAGPLFAPCSRQITTPVPHHSVFTGRMSFLPPKQQRQSTESKTQTSSQNNLMQGRIAAARGRFNRIRQAVSMCTAFNTRFSQPTNLASQTAS